MITDIGPRLSNHLDKLEQSLTKDKQLYDRPITYNLGIVALIKSKSTYSTFQLLGIAITSVDTYIDHILIIEISIRWLQTEDHSNNLS